MQDDRVLLEQLAREPSTSPRSFASGVLQLTSPISAARRPSNVRPVMM
jgi:hypothetical protein